MKKIVYVVLSFVTLTFLTACPKDGVVTNAPPNESEIAFVNTLNVSVSLFMTLTQSPCNNSTAILQATIPPNGGKFIVNIPIGETRYYRWNITNPTDPCGVGAFEKPFTGLDNGKFSQIIQ